jgi:3-phosphoshikimate 1-carboxyvinyltransferase
MTAPDPIAPRAVPCLRWAADTTLELPGSKSVANRLLVAAALCGREVTVRAVSPSDDVRHLLAGLTTLGFAVHHDPQRELVRVGPRRSDAPAEGELFCGNAGTALRFLVSLAAITPGRWTLTGDAAMQRRPIGPLVAAWRQLGLDIDDRNGCPPVVVRGSDAVHGGRLRLDASVSSQFVSSLLLIGARLPNGLTIEFEGDAASIEYARLTARTLARFGVAAQIDATGAAVAPGFAAAIDEIVVDGDWSSMGIWTCLRHENGSLVTATNLHRDSGQADEALAAVLAAIPPTGEHTIDVAPLPDQFLNLAILAARRAGALRFVGGANLRHKECDRIAVMARELRQRAVDVDELPDGMVVRGGRPLSPGVVDPEGDHRVAMAFALAGLLQPGITIADPGCVTKSYPRFWPDLDRVAANHRPLAIVGMRGAGKSTLARALAAATGLALVDSDERFIAAHGPIAAFVATNGWPAFRAEEERLVAAALQPNTIVSTGGGALESERTRGLLRERALVLWLDAPLALLQQRLAIDGASRPSITGAPVLDELPALLAKRRPYYAAVAHVRVDAELTTAAQCASALEQLATAGR